MARLINIKNIPGCGEPLMKWHIESKGTYKNNDVILNNVHQLTYILPIIPQKSKNRAAPRRSPIFLRFVMDCPVVYGSALYRTGST
jgi:hypothetical protein